MNRQGNTYMVVLCGLAVAINVVLGSVVANLKIPLLFLDTMGTIFVAVVFGPWPAFLVGILTNLISGITAGPTDIPFGLVNGVVGLVTGYIARKFGFNLITAIITGIILSIVAPVIGTPIAVAVYDGLTGGATDIFVLWLKKSGMGIFTAAFIPRITENFIDKILSCVLVMYIIRMMPVSMIRRLKKTEQANAAQ